MVGAMTVEVKWDKAAGATKAQVNRMIVEEYEIVGKTWHRKHRPKHFTRQAINRYGYTRRSKSYNRSKIRATGKALPLVKSGESLARSALISRITSSVKKGVAVVMPVRTFNFRPKNSNINMLREFQTHHASEIAGYERVMGPNLERRLDKVKPRRRRLRA